jgi:hypothetical protein
LNEAVLDALDCRIERLLDGVTRCGREHR